MVKRRYALQIEVSFPPHTQKMRAVQGLMHQLSDEGTSVSTLEGGDRWNVPYKARSRDDAIWSLRQELTNLEARSATALTIR
jgi:hypothetical protein